MQFIPIIERAPFQVYGAALAFCPNNSPVKSTFRDRVLPFAKRIKYPHDDWSPILQVLEGHKYDVTSVAFSNDGKLIASASADDKICLWDTETGSLKRRLRIENASLENTAFSPRGQLIASGSYEKQQKFTIERDDFLSNEHWHPGQGARLDSLAFSANGSAKVSGSGHGSLQLWDPETGKPSKELLKHSSTTRTVAFSPDGTMVASSYDCSIRLWDLKSCSLPSEQLLELKKPRDNMRRMVLSSDRKILADLSEGKTMNIWKLEAGTLIPQGARFPAIEKFAFSPRCDVLAFTTAESDPRIQIWNLTEGEKTYAVEKIGYDVEELSFSSDGNTLAVLLSFSVHLLDPATGATRQILESP
ncbi:uncharacterized protein NECHADRAFT_53746, partial [Fusarium vanettenii 77-13-4]